MGEVKTACTCSIIIPCKYKCEWELAPPQLAALFLNLGPLAFFPSLIQPQTRA